MFAQVKLQPTEEILPSNLKKKPTLFTLCHHVVVVFVVEEQEGGGAGKTGCYSLNISCDKS